MKKLTLIFLAGLSLANAERISLFDGKTLAGWDIPDAEKKWWKVEDGKIVGGSMTEKVPLNTFLSAAKTYANFDLRFKVRLTQGKGFTNSGIQVRSTRGKDGHMSGYQVDAGKGYWGTIWDEHRRNKKIATPVDEKALAAVVEDFGWNEYRILCEGPRIRNWINGVLAIDYVEKDPAIPLDGLIGLQAHSGGTFLVEFSDITIEALPDTKAGGLDAASEQSSFVLPEGYEIELVASEEQGVIKPITVSWDAAGKMWTMTAREYPVDANENKAQSDALFARGGSDQVLVFDNPYGPGPHTPRTFTNGLVIPLGVLPTKRGALVQYGTEIREYFDTDGDGKADGHEVILEGFGTQDSHLFPHQFEHAAGGWIYVAQGLFNRSTVTRPGGKPFVNGENSVTFDQCKLARFRTDGSEFELLTAGPNNIWGFGTDRDGEVFLQEANDIAIPVAEFLPGTHYPTGSREKLRPYAPQIPASTKGRLMGGTGLSGIAIASDRGTEFAKNYAGRRTFYIANPITNRIQVVTMSQDAQGRPTYAKEEDFMTTTDQRFRPVAVRFGPDGNLYVVDWYNKIISHNEVPRAHPDRDKTRGRIWRIKPKGQATPKVPDLAAMDMAGLITALDHPVALVSQLAWQEIGKRGDSSVIPKLTAIVDDKASSLPRRIAAFWALQEMGALDPALLFHWAADPERHLRYEVLRAAGDIKEITSADFVKLIQPGESDFRVRSIASTAVRRRPEATSAMLAALVPFVAPQSAGATERERYESDFLRYQIRWAFEKHSAATQDLIANGNLPAEAKSLAVLSLSAEKAAMALVETLPTLGRPLSPDELGVLGGQLKQPAVAAAFAKMLSQESTRASTLRSLMSFDAAAASDKTLRSAVAEAASSLGVKDKSLLLDLARRFRLKEAVPAIAKMADSGDVPRADALKTFNEIGVGDPALFEAFLSDPDATIQREAVIGYSSSAGIDGVAKIAGMWDGLPGLLRQLALDGMLRTKESAAAFVLAAAGGKFKGAGASATERAISLLGMEHPAITKLLESSEGLLVPVISLKGDPGGHVPVAIDLDGPFTVETWVRLDAPVDNSDSLLGKAGVADFNFYAGSLRLHSGGKDQIVASRPVAPGIWTHFAVTRDAAGKLRIFIDGEPDPASGAPFTGEMPGLNPGVSFGKGGTSGKFLSFRVWGRARTEEEIRGAFRTRFSEGDLPEGLRVNLPQKGGAAVTMTADFPELRTPAEAVAIAEKFRVTKAKAAQAGDAAQGRKLAEATCMICHQIKGGGQAIGPDLSGAGAMGIDALLHNILLPNEQLESGYYRHDVTLKDGTFASGFLASENKEQLVLRQIGSDDRVIPRGQIASHDVSKRSLMPEGLIDGFTDQQVADLFAYLLSLK
jgi:putative membrane-bound dehydrogenase-like protein